MLILAFSILLLVFMISLKINPLLSLLAVTIMAGLMFGLPIGAVMNSVNKGVGSTLGSIALVLALGAMIGKLAEESGAARKMVMLLGKLFGIRHIQWAVLCTGLLAGIPLFYNAGFVILIPLVFAIARNTGLPLLYVGIPMAASLSVTHGFLPPHPGPVAIAGIFNADIGEVLVLGLLLAIPVAIIAGIIFPRLISGNVRANKYLDSFSSESALPSAAKSFFILLSPVVFIAAGTIGVFIYEEASIFIFLQDPVIALLLSLLITLLLLRQPLATSMLHCMEGVRSVAMILLVIAAGGAFKQVLIDSHIGDTIKAITSSWNLSPLFLAWCITAVFRIALGSATVAALTSSGMVLPLITEGVSAELMVLSVGAGSLMCSHVNDTGFWMFKEYFGLTIVQTFKTWTIMESLISILGLTGVLLLDRLI